MANNSAILSIRIVGDATSAVREFQRTEERAKAMQRGLERASQISAVALGAIATAAWSVAQAASDAQQAAGAVESVFGASAETIKGYAADAAQAVGLSAASYNQLASVLGAQLTNMGLAGGELATQTNSLIGLGADLAATFGGTTADAVAAVSSLLRGERDPIERYGVAIKQADVDARLAAQGLNGLTGEAQRNAQMQATLAILTEQTAAAQGQFGRESETAAGAQQRLNAEWQNAQASLGEALLPAVSQFATGLAEVARWVGENTALVQLIVGVFGGLAAAILLVQGATIAWNIAMNANPIFLLVTIILTVVGALITMAGGWDEVGRVAGEIMDGIVAGVQTLIGWIQDAIGWLGDLLGLNQQVSAAGSQATTPIVPEPMVAPMSLSSTTASLEPVSASISGSGATAAPVIVQEGDRINLTVNGALDKDGTAREVEDVLARRARRTGRTPGINAKGQTRWR